MARAAPKSKKRPAPKSKKEEKKEEEETEVSAEEKEEVNDQGSDNENDKESDQEDDQNDEPPTKKGRGRAPAKGAKKGKAAKKTPSRPASKGRKSTKKDESEDDEKEYDVEKVVDVRTRKGAREFFIKWKNYPKSQNTWEPEEHLNCEEAIKAFEAEQEKRKNTPVKMLRTERKETERYVDVAGSGNKLRHSRRHGKEVRKSYREAPDSD